MRVRSKVVAITVTCAALLAGAACGSSGSTGGDAAATSGAPVPAVTADPALHARLPQAIVDKGAITNATDGSIGVPWAFAESGQNTLQGLDIDLGQAIADKLGVKQDVQNVPFANLLPGIQSKRYDVSISVAFDTAEREKVVDIVNFIQGGSGFIVKKGGPADLALGPKLCGLSVGALAGGVEVDELNKASTESCAGNPIKVQSFPAQSGGVLALQSGQIDAYDGDSLQNAYIESQNPGLVQSGQPYGVVKIGMLVGKGSNGDGMAPLLRDTVQSLIDDGTYGKILAKWGVQIGAVQQATVNGASA